VDIDQFKISKQQKKHMKRFNQMMNGTREFEIEQIELELFDDKTTLIQNIFKSKYSDDLEILKSNLIQCLEKTCENKALCDGIELHNENFEIIKKSIK
jgi:hypothetical protein